MFDEDIKTLIFPKIKSYLFRVSSESLLEIGAKILAIKNDEHHNWRNYTFSLIKKH